MDEEFDGFTTGTDWTKKRDLAPGSQKAAKAPPAAAAEEEPEANGFGFGDVDFDDFF